jgi:hypothetical protein
MIVTVQYSQSWSAEGTGRSEPTRPTTRGQPRQRTQHLSRTQSRAGTTAEQPEVVTVTRALPFKKLRSGDNEDLRGLLTVAPTLKSPSSCYQANWLFALVKTTVMIFHVYEWL